MSHALLVQRLVKTVISRGAVVDQSAGVVQTDDFLQSVGTAVRVNDITGGLVTDPGMKPDGSASVAPPCFIGGDDLGVLDRLLDFLINRLQLGGGPQHDTSRRAGLDVDAVGFLEVVGDLAIGQAATLVEIDNTGLGVRPELAGSGAGGIGRLQGMPATDTLAASLAAALVDAKFATDRPGGDVGLELFIDVVILTQFAAAIGASLGQRRFEDFVDRFGRRRRSM